MAEDTSTGFSPTEKAISQALESTNAIISEPQPMNQVDEETLLGDFSFQKAQAQAKALLEKRYRLDTPYEKQNREDWERYFRAHDIELFLWYQNTATARKRQTEGAYQMSMKRKYARR